MTRYVKVREVCVHLELDEAMLREIVEEGLVEVHRPLAESEDVVSEDDADRMRVIVVLMREMGVNLAGAEVILHMRQEQISMRSQFDEVVATLVRELRKQVGGK